MSSFCFKRLGQIRFHGHELPRPLSLQRRCSCPSAAEAQRNSKFLRCFKKAGGGSSARIWLQTWQKCDFLLKIYLDLLMVCFLVWIEIRLQKGQELEDLDGLFPFENCEMSTTCLETDSLGSHRLVHAVFWTA